MHVETKHGHRVFSFANKDGEVEISIQKIAGAGIVWYGVLDPREAMNFAQQIEEAAMQARDGSCDALRNGGADHPCGQHCTCF